MLKTNLYDHTGKVIKEVTLPNSLFAVKVDPALLAQALHVYRVNSHQGTSRVLSRGEVERTKAKWYKQKGTGRARHGARSAPLFVGGGVAHGPKGLKAANLKLTDKMKRLSTLAVLFKLAQKNQVSLISNLDKISAKTKDLTTLLDQLKSTTRTILLTAKTYENLKRSAKNIKIINLLPYAQINAYALLNTKQLIIDESALELMQKWLNPKLSTKN